ncbi:hypothetical protein JD974_12220 [Chromobacterium haemolyticum]|uniref:Uncharacterized protein n=1 Tax=Chromobacterium haemolyticum TaxID=394935 RepID=A0ABS3GPT3_9NEIS|nr:hypothetical protein [Chromobacterium haemolyticum]MBK0415170.1 hypothetical protein [Chromobacterium haemolyticum]MBO0416615.1 hypothetical protein [Chromobacterium haemolyticum]MBO0499809.1 hypothetical protein [Chromobacterium haemolyticum]BBH13350.1 hypothetical protein CH06BL_25980 [Chromobacterium haemolyticum]
MDKLDFMKEEYLTLRKEVETAVAELSNVERQALFASAIIYSWLSTTKLSSPVISLAWFVPTIIIFFSGLRCYTIGQHLRRLSTYIKKIEAEMASQNQYATGWEHFHSAETRNKLRTFVTLCFWIIALVATVLIGGHYKCH